MDVLAPLRHGHLLTRVLVPAAGCVLLATATLSTGAPSAGSPRLLPAASSSAPLRFGSFNVLSVGVDRTEGLRRPWKQRRGTVIRQVLGEHVDVLGVQETTPSSYFAPRLVDGRNQFLDLRNGLNKAGGHYALANSNAYNCVNSTTSYKCRPRNRNASGSERILYDTRKVSLVRSGAMAYHAQVSPKAGSYLAWAWLRSKANGHRFLFTTTHLEPRNRSVRLSQWRQMIARVDKIKRGYPVVSVGDFNTQKFDPMAKEMLPAMKRAGIGDVLNQQYRVNPPRGIRAQTRTNAWLSTLNHDNRDLTKSGYTSQRNKVGNGIDYVFASNRLRVRDYKVVVHYDPQRLRILGTLPSDHNLIRSTIYIP